MKRMFYLVGLILLPLALYGCGGDDGTSGPAEGVDVTGTWKGMSSDGIAFTANLVQQGDGTLTGTVVRQEGYSGSAGGRVSGHDFAMHVIWTYGGTGDYEGEISGNAMEGTFNETLGAMRMTGTFTAFKQ